MRGARIAFALCLVLAARNVSAQPSDAHTEAARKHFSAGVKLYDAKDYPAALEEFRRAYAEKPSPGIKRNVALCLKELHRYPEAIEALEQMLDEGGDSIKPEVRDGARKTIDEMLPLVASLRIRVVSTHAAVQPAYEVFVDDQPVSAERLSRSVRVMPGSHKLRARALGFQEATQTVEVDAGAYDVPVTLELVSTALAPMETLTVRAVPPDSDIVLD